ncbi:MAG TPA: Ig-like domain-containing protein, partial [Mobilitalea sp.]|nr:Ig-like domain-containing protein [Mobilitalea sp.]
HGVQENIAIYTNSNLNISGGTITARSGDILGDGASYGIYAGISLTVSGGTITVSCGNATVYYAIVTPTSPTFFGYTPLIMAGDSEENASRVTTPIESYGFIESYIRIEPSYTITYIITYRPGANGSGSVSTDSKIHATDIGLRGVTFTRTGYTQTGWATSDGGAKSYELEAIYSVDEAVDLYPVWTIIDLPDPDIATVDAAKIAAYNASYLNMTQASTVSGAAINVTLKATAEAAVNNSSVTTTINGISYTEPVVGTSANPNGTNGTYTFTVTVTKGVQSQTTEQKSITIISTPFIGATDTEAVEAAKVVIVNGTVNVAYGANQNTKTAAVQTYMNNLINSTATATGVTGIVTYSSGNTYSVTISKGSASDTKTISMTVNEAANPSPTPTPTPVPNPDPTPVPDPDPTPSTVERTEGTVEKDKQQDEGAPVANINNSSDELKTTVLTHDEQELVARGENAKIILKVTDIGSSISEEEKKLIQDKLVAENKKEEKEADEDAALDIAILYVDLTLYKQVGSQEQTKVTETNEKISISLEIPEEFWNTDKTKSREFYVMRIHEGKVTRIEGSYDAIKQIFTFETDRFSTYALTYQDSNKIATYEGFRYLQLKVKSDKTSQTLSYKRKGTIDGYLIFGGKCGEEMVELADLPAKTTGYVIEDCIPRTFYKYQVKAYRVIDGEKIIVMTSKAVHSIVNGKTYADPTKVTLDMTSITLTKGDNKVLTGQVVLPKGKKLKTHTTVIRFESSNSEIASVNSKGKITGKAEGTCYIYAYAQNGVYKRIKVTVK